MRGFGDLESAIMEILWSSPELMSVRQVRERLAADRPLAYTTVMTVLDNLHRKGWLRRQLAGRAYCYQPVAPREAYTAQLMSEALAASRDHTAAFSHFVEALTPEEAAELQRLLGQSGESR